MVDTGASASFVPGGGAILANNSFPHHPTKLDVSLGDDSNLMIRSKIITQIQLDEVGAQTRATLYILTNNRSLVGCDMIIGIDLISALHISIEASDGRILLSSKKKILNATMNPTHLTKMQLKLVRASVSLANIQNPRPLNLPYLRVIIEGRKYLAMVDTGISFVPGCGAILADNSFTQHSSCLDVSLGNDSKVPVISKINAPLQREGDDNQTQAVLYILTNKQFLVGCDMIIGVDLIPALHISIEPPGGHLIIPTMQNSPDAAPIQEHLAKISTDPIPAILNKYDDVFENLADSHLAGEFMRFPTYHERPITAKARRYSSEDIN